METLLLIIMGLFGIVLYTAVKTREYIADDTFDLKFLVRNNLKIWVWSGFIVVMVAIILLIEPAANDIIKQMVGLDLMNTKPGWLLFGAGLCGLFRNTKVKK